MRFGFVTCVQLGLSCMEEIASIGGKLDLVITLPDDRAVGKSGRVFVDDYCRRHSVPLTKAANVNDPTVIKAIGEHRIDWLFIVGWSQIARKEVLEAPREGVLGMHPTLLPQGRGRASIPWAILKGLDETGVTLFQLDEGVDTGPIVRQERISVSPTETASTLYDRVVTAHRKLIAHAWWDLAENRICAVPQDETQATEWPGRSPENGRIVETMSVGEVERLVRATTRPYPGAFVRRDDGSQLRIWSGRIGDPAHPPSGPRVQLADGVYDALEYDIEPTPVTLP